MKLFITKNGDIECLYSDLLLSLHLGALKIRRASSIEFNEHTQCWDVDVLGEGVLSSYTTRAEALAWEVEYLNNKLATSNE